MAAEREWFDKDYYAVLGVPMSAPDKDVARAYKKLAKQFHPDANPGNKDAEERFKEISAAYDVLGDANKRKEYDEVRRMVASGVGPGFVGGGPGGQSFTFDASGADSGILSDLLGGFFGGGRGRGGGRRAGQSAPQRGSDLETDLQIGFDDAVHGVTSTVRFRADAACSTCNGTGAEPGTHPETCPECHGSGQVAVEQGPFSFAQVCPTCSGRGQVVTSPCSTCRGRGVENKPREVKVRIPAGVADGQRIRVKGRGAAGVRGGQPGDLYVNVRVGAHPVFGRDGDHVTVKVPVTFAEAALGADVRVPTLDGQVTVRIPPGTPSGKVLRVRGKGVPSNNGKSGGDLLVTVDVAVPTELNDEQREALDSLAKVFDTDVRAPLFTQQHNRRRTDSDGTA
jgi:molecular chaperone DnaJ